MKKDRLISYMSEHFYSGQDKYHGNKIDHEIFQKNIGKEIPLSLAEWNDYDKKYYWSKLMITPVRFMGYDSRPEFQIPNDEKSFSKKYGKYVPNRYHWRIKPV